MLEGFDSINITIPNGGDVISSTNLFILWTSNDFILGDPYNFDPYNFSSLIVSGNYWFELFYTSNFVDANRENQDWVQLASIPLSATGSYTSFTYNWRIPKSLKGNKFRIGIRVRDYRGQRGMMIYSATNFSILNKFLQPPAVVNPVSNASYTSIVPFVFEPIENIPYLQRCFYQIYYKSDKLNLDWQPVFINIATNTRNLEWNIKGLSFSDDYAIRVFAMDDDGNQSHPIIIDGLQLKPTNTFIIDSNPPKGSIQIQNSTIFSRNRAVTVALTAYDEGTNAYSVTMNSLDPYGSNTEVTEIMSALKSFTLSDRSGEHLLQAVFKDYANNYITIDNNVISFKDYASGETAVPTALFFDDPEVFTVLIDNEYTIYLTTTDDNGVLTNAFSVSLTVKNAVTGEIIVQDETSSIVNESTGYYSYKFIITSGITYLAEWTIVQNQGDNNTYYSEQFGPFVISGNTDISSLWVAYGGSSPILKQDNILISSLNNEATRIFKLDNTIYVVLRNGNDRGVLQSLSTTDSSLTTLHTFTSDDSIVISSEEYDNKVFLGMQNGELYSFNGSTISLIYSFDNQINYMIRVNNLLYIFVEFSLNIYVYNGSTIINTGEINVY